ncbi:hypothetical protein GQ457_11G018540 [Hibiscus cannabinus]
MERRLVGDHEEKEDEQKRHPPRRPSCPVKRILLRFRDQVRNVPGAAVEQKQKHHRGQHEEELDLAH